MTESTLKPSAAQSLEYPGSYVFPWQHRQRACGLPGHVASESDKQTDSKEASSAEIPLEGRHENMTSAWGWAGFRSYTCRNMLSRRNSRYQGPEAELSWESKGSVAVNGQDRSEINKNRMEQVSSLCT